ncbi:MAG: hypothetical protein RLZZ546_2309 [Bacteroidota bacterium]|jgi:hypothetical protein
MNLEEHKIIFKNSLDIFSKKLQNIISTEDGSWSIKGIIDLNENIYPITHDTKIISKILEIQIFPYLIEFAENNGYRIMLTKHQNYYPDLTFINIQNENIKFAVDLKTAYRKKNNTINFTLGSHGSYFKQRDKKKNILFPYNKYSGHFCLCLLYSRTLEEEKKYKLNFLNNKKSSIGNIEIFVAEKWKIASDKQGSGNTANIGSCSNINDLKNEKGIFSNLGEEWFDMYWTNYGEYIKHDNEFIKITSLKQFLFIKNREDLLEIIKTK